VSSSAQYGLTIATATVLTVPGSATYASACARGGAANYTTDGTIPTNSVGMSIPQSTCVPLYGASVMSAFKAIQQSATSPATTLDVSYYR